jgi:hypothetical protein
LPSTLPDVSDGTLATGPVDRTKVVLMPEEIDNNSVNARLELR